VRELNGRARKYLRGLAHPLKPVVQVGKGGINDNLILNVESNLLAHELIKVKFVGLKEQKQVLSAEIAGRTGSVLAGIVGNIAIFYREHPEADQRTIHLREQI
jgi:RNA-binding protein